MNNVFDLVTLLFQGSRITRSISWSKYHFYLIVIAVLVVIVKAVGYLASFLFGQWIDTVSSVFIVLMLIALVGVPALTRRFRESNLTENLPKLVHRPVFEQRHPLERRLLVPHRFLVVHEGVSAINPPCVPAHKKPKHPSPR